MARLTTLKPRVQVLGPRLAAQPKPSQPEGSGQGLYTYRWKQARLAFLRQHPLCQCPDCAEGVKRVTAASVVDHHEPHHNDPVKFWDQANWRALAKACHDRLTVKHDGGFGNPITPKG